MDKIIINFGWGENYLLPVKAATQVLALMAEATRVTSAQQYVDGCDLYVSAGKSNVQIRYVQQRDEFALDCTMDTPIINDFRTHYNATRTLGGDVNVLDLTYAEYLATLDPINR